uniref:Reverse transcriptase domain-containing protein n=1 Tax=Fagus sylvatica TaxID=28930 RepID=A0A2N9IRH8_FAGSY
MEEVAISENNHGSARLPTFNRRKIRSEVRVPGGQRGREEQRSYGRIEGRQHSPSKEPSFLGEARKKRRIEELEEELRLLKEEDKEKDDQHQRRRSRSHSGSCGSPNHVPSHKERGRKSKHRHQRSMSPKKRRLGRSRTPPPQHKHNPIWRKLQQISFSPFSAEIERAKFPARFVPPNLAVYDGKGDPVGHLSRYRQSMALHTSNDALMCRIFPSSLGEVGLRCLRKLMPLLALKMKAEETLKSYSARYWEVYNDIDACDEDIVVKTFRFGLNQDIKLRRSLTKRPPISMADLMTRLEEHIRVEDDSKSSARTMEAAPPSDKKAAQPEQNQAKRSRRSTEQPRAGTCMAVHTVFKQPIYRLLPFIKDKPYFEWPAKMPGDPATREGKPYCSYHRERGHLTEQCRAYKYHLEQLVKNGHLRQYIDETKNSHQNNEAPKLTIKDSAPIGIIDVIHYGTTSRDQRGEMRRAAHLREVFQIGDSAQMAPVPLKRESTEQIVFTNQDLEGVQLPHSDALVVTLRIDEFDVKRILIDPGSSVEIMYESLFKGLGLEKKDLNLVEEPLSGFSGETVVPSRKKDEAQRQFLIGDSLSEEAQDTAADPPQRIPRHLCMDSSREQEGRHHNMSEAVREEVERLLKIGAVREVLYPQWLSNTVVVKKKNGKWRVCVDFTDLNKACPKDPFPLPKIDQLVDSTAGHERMSFLDAFQGYHQIALRKEDQEKTAFITPRGIFCYKVMPFGLKNAGATYQRMVTKMFSELLGKTVEVYIDDMVVKSIKSTDHVEDLRKVFEILRRHNLKLNATKCAFGVGSGKFLGFLVTQRGIEANPDQIAAIQGLQPPKNVREVQRLTGMAAALNRFISKSAERYLLTPPLLSSPKEGEPLYIYLAASDKAVSAAIIRDDSGEQRPVYYTSKTMNGAETRSSDFSGRISKWGAHLGAYDVCYKPRTSIKGQVLADFIAEFAPEKSDLPTIGEHPKDDERILEKNGWTLYVDGVANSRGSDLGVVLISPGGELLEQAVRLGFGASNNEAEYEGTSARPQSRQTTGMVPYRDLAKDLLKGFREFNIERVGREHNGHADSLAGLASSVAPDFRRTITVEVQDSPSIMKSSQAIICQIEMGPSWMDPILDYLTKDILPADQKEAAKIRKNATWYWVSREGKVIHEGVCGGHTGGRSLAHRAIGQGYWWPYMQKDAAQYVKRCEKCQLFAPAIHKPTSQLNPISSPWPFAQWGLDLVGPLPRATGNRQWLIVATDYFTNSTADHSRSIAQSSESEITSPARPTHRETDKQNPPIRQSLTELRKDWKKLRGDGWRSCLPYYGRSEQRPEAQQGKPLFSLTYGVEVVIPLEVGLPTLRAEEYDQENNELMLAKDMDQAQERRDLAMIRLASYQGDLKKRYGKNVSEEEPCTRRLGITKSAGKQKGPHSRQTRSKLGRTLSDHFRGRTGSIQPQGNGRQTSQKTLEYKQPEEVLPVGRYGTTRTTSKPWPRPGALPMNPQVVWRNGIKTLATPRCSAYESSSGMVERHQILAMLGVSPVNPQVVWRNGIKTLATPRCSAYESSSGMVERHQILAMLGVSPVNPQVVWRNGIKTLATPRCSACESSSGMVERHQILAMLGVSPMNPQVVWRDGIKTLAMSRSSAGESSSSADERRYNLAVPSV